MSGTMSPSSSSAAAAPTATAAAAAAPGAMMSPTSLASSPQSASSASAAAAGDNSTSPRSVSSSPESAAVTPLPLSSARRRRASFEASSSSEDIFAPQSEILAAAPLSLHVLGPTKSTSQPGAQYALAIMTMLNLLNYADRFVPSACKSLIQDDLHLSDVQTALPMGAFLLIYMLTSPIFGYLADQGHVKRTVLIGAGVFMWSCATVAGAFATNFTTFLLARAAVGVGEAAYATIAPALLCDFFPVSQRPKVLSFFYLAIPVGAALGYAVAGQVGSHYGWRAAFMVCGLPGMLLVFFVLGMREPERGVQDAAHARETGVASGIMEAQQLAAVAQAEEEDAIGWPEAIGALLSNAHYMHALAAVTLVSFASGAIADWLPTWLTRVQGISIGHAGLLVGAVTCVAGVGGSLSGFVIAEWLSFRGVRNSYFVLGSASQVVTCLFSAGLLMAGAWATMGEVVFMLFICQFCMWLNMGGCSAIIANSVHPRIRSRAFGLSILVSHLGGDAISPALVGIISDRSGGDLTKGFSVVPVAFGLAAIVFALAAYNLHATGPDGEQLVEGSNSGSGNKRRAIKDSSASDEIELQLAGDEALETHA